MRVGRESVGETLSMPNQQATNPYLKSQAGQPLREQNRHWCYHKQAIVTLIEIKNNDIIMGKMANNSSNLMGRGIESRLKPVGSQAKE